MTRKRKTSKNRLQQKKPKLKINSKNYKSSNKYKLLLILLVLIGIGSFALYSTYKPPTSYVLHKNITNINQNGAIVANQKSANNTSIRLTGLFPQQGVKTQVKLGNVVPTLIASGTINLTKVKLLYRGNLTQKELDLLTKPSNSTLTLNASNANFYLLILWALGISNKNPILDNFSLQTNVSDLASVGGWTLGTNDNAMLYFDKLSIVNLTQSEQAEVQYIAMHTYRPCCNNPTGFPDCNHGAALLALIELGASQGLNESKLYTLALQAQTLWFPSYYAATAISLQSQNISYWNNPQLVLSKNYSSYYGWYYDVYKPLQASNSLPNVGSQLSCAA